MFAHNHIIANCYQNFEITRHGAAEKIIFFFTIKSCKIQETKISGQVAGRKRERS